MRLSLYEGAAFGANMSAPYGSWMGSTIEDSFYAPHDLLVEVQSFLADNDRLYRRQSCHEVAVVYSVESASALVSKADASDNLSNTTDQSVQVPYRVVTRGLADAGVPFDVVLFPDGETAPDRISAPSLDTYRTVVLPDCHHLTPRQADTLLAYVEGGGYVVALGGLGDNLDRGVQQALAGHEGVHRAELVDLEALTPFGPQVEVSVDVAVNVNLLDDGSAAVHLLDYGYDRETDGVPAHEEVSLSVRLPFDVAGATLVSPGSGDSPLPVASDSDAWTVRLPSFRLYAVVVFDAVAP
jgi:hypothetical protein